MQNSNTKLIRKINKYKHKCLRNKLLTRDLNKTLFITTSALLMYMVYFALIIKNNFDASNISINNIDILQTTRTLFFLLALFISNIIVFYSRKEILKKEVTSLLSFFPNIDFFSAFLYVNIPIMKVYLLFLLLVSLPSYISFVFFNISLIVILSEIFIFILNSFLFYFILISLDLFVSLKKIALFPNIILVVIINLFLVLFTNLLTNSTYFYIFFILYFVIMFSFVISEIYPNSAKFYYSKLYGNTANSQILKKKHTVFKKNSFFRYIQFDIKRLISDGIIKDYIYTLCSLLIAYIFIRLFILKEFSSVFNFIVSSFGIVELQVIFSTSLGLFIVNRLMEIKNALFNVNRYYFYTIVLYIIINFLISGALSILFFGLSNDLYLFFLNVVTVVNLSILFSYLFSFVTSKKLNLLCINIILINIIQTFLSYITKGNFLSLGILILIINVVTILCLSILIQRKREIIR